MSNSKNIDYTTDDELAFLDKINRNIFDNSKRIKVLEGYIESAKTRTNWGGVNKSKAISHALRMINS